MMQLFHNKQRGFSLVEMMIGLVISLLLIFGVVAIYVNSKRGYSLQDGMAHQQENARFSIDILLHDLRMAGYDSSVIKLKPIVAATDGGSTTSDSITVQYQSITDCLGQATPANSCTNLSGNPTTFSCAVNRYFIDASGNLACQGNGSTATDIIADGIYDMQILYGIDTDNNNTDEANYANKYVTWPNVTDATRIVSIRIGLLSRTPTDVASASNTSTIMNLNQSVSVTDKRIHRGYVNTVMLRNWSDPNGK
ncbi:MAG: PilW family protein [Gammaproteobacteria bacterium]|nr:PilW family protein [Gammaproteobacteria bacterium]